MYLVSVSFPGIFFQIFSRAFPPKEQPINSFIYSNATISDKMVKVLKLYKDNIKYIENSFKYDNNNGIIEGTNNLIKCIKRIAFGYRKYDHFISRIFLIKGIIKGWFSSPSIINSFIKFIVHQHYLTKNQKRKAKWINVRTEYKAQIDK